MINKLKEEISDKIYNAPRRYATELYKKHTEEIAELRKEIKKLESEKKRDIENDEYLPEEDPEKWDNPNRFNELTNKLRRLKNDKIYNKKIKMTFYIKKYIDRNDELIKKTFKEFSTDRYNVEHIRTFNLTDDEKINEVIKIIEVLRNYKDALNLFYIFDTIGDKKKIIGLGIKKNNKKNNSYLSLLKSMI
jgi:hypothetical protein